MIWKKKLREYKGTNYYYSLRKKLKREKKIDDHFEVLVKKPVFVMQHLLARQLLRLHCFWELTELST
jgi:hypothetical protein